MNKIKLTNLCHKISEKTNLKFNTVMFYYFLESILKRLSGKEYSENFIFKGGFLLSNIIGVETRTTMDIDLLLKNIQLSKEKIFIILNEVLKDDSNDEIKYEIQNISPIREEDKYGGLRAKILCKFDNIRIVVPLDIATGDIVTPYPIDYNYISVFSDEKILIKAYSIEAMIAEKLQTIYIRGFLNSRSKDYYDLYILYKLKINDIDFNILSEACKKTFAYRKTDFNLNKLRNLLEKLKEDKSFLKQWKNYSKKNNYVGNINFENVINNILKIIERIKK